MTAPSRYIFCDIDGTLLYAKGSGRIAFADAFRDAEMLAETILTGRSLYDYEASRNANSAELFDITDRIAALDWSLDDLKGLHLRLNEMEAGLWPPGYGRGR